MDNEEKRAAVDNEENSHASFEPEPNDVQTKDDAGAPADGISDENEESQQNNQISNQPELSEWRTQSLTENLAKLEESRKHRRHQKDEKAIPTKSPEPPDLSQEQEAHDQGDFQENFAMKPSTQETQNTTTEQYSKRRQKEKEKVNSSSLSSRAQKSDGESGGESGKKAKSKQTEPQPELSEWRTQNETQNLANLEMDKKRRQKEEKFIKKSGESKDSPKQQVRQQSDAEGSTLDAKGSTHTHSDSNLMPEAVLHHASTGYSNEATANENSHESTPTVEGLFHHEPVIEGFVAAAEVPHAVAQPVPPLLSDSLVFQTDPQQTPNKTSHFQSRKWALLIIGLCWVPLIVCLALVGVIAFVLVKYVSPSSTLSYTASPTPNPSLVPTPPPTSPPTSSSPTLNPTFASPPPTSPPTLSKFVTVKNIVEANMEVIPSTDMTSPQIQAINWLAHEDEFDMNFSDVEGVLERYALVTFHFAAGKEGTSGIGHCKFLTKEHICGWNNVSDHFSNFDEGTRYCGAVCDSSQKHIIELHIGPNTLNGTLPEEIGLLSKLEVMEIENNIDLVGPLPRSIGRLNKLVNLTLSFTGLSGELPSSLGNLSHLHSLSLNGNNFNSTLPSALGALTNFRHLSLFNNLLTGTIPSSFRNLSNLKTFDVTRNFLTGTSPFEKNELPKMRFFSVGHNALDGSIPEAIFTFSSLSTLFLDNNLFIGTVSPNFALLPELVTLDLGSNDLVGSIPSSIGTLSKLEGLYLYDNLLSGNIPHSVAKLGSLKDLSLFANGLTGPIPSEIGDLHRVNLFNNLLTGSIPDLLGNLAQLSWLNIGMNSVNGTLPTSFSNLKSLDELYVHRTNLEGDMDFMSDLGPFLVAAADCRGNDPKMMCSFCTVCCADNEGCIIQGANSA